MSENTTTKVSDDELKEMESQTDWKALQAKTDAEIQQDIAADPDAHALDADWFQVAQSVVPSSTKKRITIRLDEDIIAYFKREGDGYQSRINDVLKTFVIAKRIQDERSSRSP
ncbi:hypothetical protein CRI93_06625 [Longimonas halophila]|uniref:3-oxoacyl-ACP synthase n=1 Tax=Longimonas halophila TaxID=1469170 RepID=A0A2H3NTP0_9BACT|nr:BrnA antitoxin family protein [Longimonas halophila]PEN07651.1 hypothetical protein CRI93_06625 [Longimonas halophila]